MELDDNEIVVPATGILIIIWLLIEKWREIHFKSYQVFRVVGTWLIPIVFDYWCWNIVSNRFHIIWLIFSISSFLVVLRVCALNMRNSGKSPRFVYKWFLFLHNISYMHVVSGLLLILQGGISKGNVFDNKVINEGFFAWITVSTIVYGLYYGVLSRDLAQFCSERMALNIGHFTEDGLPIKCLEKDVCSVCGNHTYSEIEQLHKNSNFSKTTSSNEKIFRLECGHIAHEYCIRGWKIVGKSQACPYCKTKIDLHAMIQNPWETSRFFYRKSLNIMRFFACWFPIMMVTAKLIFNIYYFICAPKDYMHGLLETMVHEKGAEHNNLNFHHLN